MSLDRNSCNILVQKQENSGALKLIPIDHGLTLPDSLEVATYDLVWLDFKQAHEPFSQKTLQYIDNLDIDRDVTHCEQSFNIRPICLRNMKCSGSLLKEAASKGLTLAQIGEILCRPDEDDEEESVLERIVNKATECAASIKAQSIKILSQRAHTCCD
jgi:hypothetical protein